MTFHVIKKILHAYLFHLIIPILKIWTASYFVLALIDYIGRKDGSIIPLNNESYTADLAVMLIPEASMVFVTCFAFVLPLFIAAHCERKNKKQ